MCPGEISSHHPSRVRCFGVGQKTGLPADSPACLCLDDTAADDPLCASVISGFLIIHGCDRRGAVGFVRRQWVFLRRARTTLPKHDQTAMRSMAQIPAFSRMKSGSS